MFTTFGAEITEAINSQKKPHPWMGFSCLINIGVDQKCTPKGRNAT